MLAVNTFLAAVYSIVAYFCKNNLPEPPKHPGPAPKLDRCTVMTLGILQQFRRFASESEFYRFVETELREGFPALPHRSQYNRQLRRFSGELSQLAITVAEQLGARQIEMQAIDTTPIRVRDNHRRGNSWLLGDSDVGKSTRLGWYQGARSTLRGDCRSAWVVVIVSHTKR